MECWNDRMGKAEIPQYWNGGMGKLAEPKVEVAVWGSAKMRKRQSGKS
jgi:hypothetical protein